MIQRTECGVAMKQQSKIGAGLIVQHALIMAEQRAKRGVGYIE